MDIRDTAATALESAADLSMRAAHRLRVSLQRSATPTETRSLPPGFVAVHREALDALIAQANASGDHPFIQPPPGPQVPADTPPDPYAGAVWSPVWAHELRRGDVVQLGVCDEHGAGRLASVRVVDIELREAPYADSTIVYARIIEVVSGEQHLVTIPGRQPLRITPALEGGS